MILTQKEAKMWGEILIGFSQGKEYVYPYKYDGKGNVIEWWPLTDFTINKNCPTINMCGTSPLSLLEVELVKEKGE
jgi:hypothetical protein